MAVVLAAFLPIAMMVMMFALGLRLTPGDITRDVRQSPAYPLGLAVQVVGLPALAFVIARIMALDAALMAGLMLVAASPGGVTSNYAAHLARGKVGLSVAMTLTTSLLAPLSLPAVLVIAGIAAPEPASLLRISLGMSAVAIAPMVVGMAVARFLPRLTGHIARAVDIIARVLFLLMVLATFVSNWPAMQSAFAEAGVAVSLLAVLAPVLALAAGRAARLDGAAIRTIMVEVALQNVAITIMVAGTLLGLPALAIPGLIYAVVMNIVTLVLIGLSAFGTARGALPETGRRAG